MSNLSIPATATVASYGGLRPAYNTTLDAIDMSRLGLMRNLRELMSVLDTRERTNWRYIIQAALDAGVDDDDLRRELGTSPSTVYRWMSEDVAPREGTRRLMKGALLRLLDSKIEAVANEVEQEAA